MEWKKEEEEEEQDLIFVDRNGGKRVGCGQGFYHLVDSLDGLLFMESNVCSHTSRCDDDDIATNCVRNYYYCNL